MKSRILVIDDNPAIYEDFCRVLQKTAKPPKELIALTAALFGDESDDDQIESYQIDFAQRGQDGVKLVTQAREERWPFTIAFVDMRMPNGWDGLETIQRLWEADPHVQIVLCTAYSDYSWQEIRKRLARSDRFLILKKPFDSIEVQQIVETLVSRQEVEDLLRTSSDLLQQAQRIARLGHYTLSSSLNQLWCSDTLVEQFDLSVNTPNDLESWLERFSHDSREAIRINLLQAMRSRSGFETVCQFRIGETGTYGTCIAAGYWDFDETGQPNRFMGTLQDITRIQSLEDLVRIMEACVSQANDSIIITDASLTLEGGPTIVYVNDGFVQKTGLNAEDIIGKTTDLLFDAKISKATRHSLERGLESGSPIRVDLPCLRSDQTTYWVDANISPVRDKSGTLTHWLHTYRDISSQRSTLGDLTEKEHKVVMSVARNSEITLKEIAASLHISEHTLRNHLASIYEKLGVKNRLELYVFCSRFMDELSTD